MLGIPNILGKPEHLLYPNYLTYTDIPEKIFQHFYLTRTLLLPDFFFNTRPNHGQSDEGVACRGGNSVPEHLAAIKTPSLSPQSSIFFLHKWQTLGLRMRLTPIKWGSMVGNWCCGEKIIQNYWIATPSPNPAWPSLLWRGGSSILFDEVEFSYREVVPSS